MIDYVIVTSATPLDPWEQTHLATVRLRERPVVFLVRAGVPWPDVRSGERLYTWETRTELAQLVCQCAVGELDH